MDQKKSATLAGLAPSHTKKYADAKRRATGGSTLLLGALATGAIFHASPAAASSHREAPLITGSPKLDGTDFYMFRSYETGRSGYVTLVANYQPLQDPYGGPNYFEMDPNAYYDIKIDNNGDGIEDLTFRFQFTNTQENISIPVGNVNVPIALIAAGQVGTGGSPTDIANLNVHESYTVTVIHGAPLLPYNQAQILPPGAPGALSYVTNSVTGSKTFEKPVDNIGFKTLPAYDAYAANHIYNVNIPGCGAGRVFVGQRKDPFVVNLGETFDLVNVANPVGEAYNNSARDDLADKNVTTLALEVPINCLKASDNVIGGWTTSSETTTQLNIPGTLTATQTSRLGMPLVNELVIGLKDKDKFNASQPKNDAQFATYVTNPTVPTIIASLFSGAGVQAPTLFPRSDLVATFLTGITGVNQPAHVTPSEMLRLNTSIAVTPAGSQNRLGVIAGDNAGFPNGRRPGDDVVDIVLRVAMGRLITLGFFGTPNQAPSGALDFTDGALVNASFFDTSFPYLKAPIAGSPGANEASVPLPANPVVPGLQSVSAP
jgi:hypothetical protein